MGYLGSLVVLSPLVQSNENNKKCCILVTKGDFFSTPKFPYVNLKQKQSTISFLVQRRGWGSGDKIGRKEVIHWTQVNIQNIINHLSACKAC